MVLDGIWVFEVKNMKRIIFLECFLTALVDESRFEFFFNSGTKTFFDDRGRDFSGAESWDFCLFVKSFGDAFTFFADVVSGDFSRKNGGAFWLFFDSDIHKESVIGKSDGSIVFHEGGENLLIWCAGN